MSRKCVHYAAFLACVLLCVAMPFLMLSVEQRLELVFDAAGHAPRTVVLEKNGETVTEDGALVSLRADTAVITTAAGKEVEVPTAELMRNSAPAALFSRGTLFAVLATAAVSVLLLVILIPLNAYIIQFSIEHTPDGRFHPFDAA